jgi:hypothetical protein
VVELTKIGKKRRRRGRMIGRIIVATVLIPH